MKAFLPGSAKARHMVGLAFLAQNLGMGAILGSYSVLMPSIEANFETSRTMSSLGIGLLSLMTGLLAPLIGMMLQRFSIRKTLVVGAAINMIGYALLSFAQSISSFLLIFALLVGTGTSMMGLIAPATLVSRWYREGRGRALGLVNMPIFLIVVPPIAATVVGRYGMTAWFTCLIAMYAVLIPLMMLVQDTPDDCEQAGADADSVPVAGPRVSAGDIRLIGDPRFWLLTMGVAISTSAGSAFITHVIPFAKANAIAVQSASLLITVFGSAGLLGNIVFGWLADRIGASRTLAICALCHAILFSAMLFANGFLMLILLVALLGLFLTSIVALHGAAVGELFGRSNVSTVMGFGYFFKLPFIFGAAPLMGYMYDVTGNYTLSFVSLALATLAAAAGYFILSLIEARAGQPLRI